MSRSRRRYVSALAALLVLPPLAYWLWRAWAVYSLEVAEFAAEAAMDPPYVGDLPEQRTWELPGVGRQRAWILPSAGGAYVLVVHGSPGTGLGMLPLGRALASTGLGVLLLDLPGYGGSAGDRVWGDDCIAAIHAAVQQLVSSENARRVVGLGYSMGTCVLGRAAGSEPRIERVVLLAPLTRLSSQLHHQFRSRLPGISSVAVFAARSVGVAVADLDLLAAAPALADRPVLLIAGDRDDATPPAMASRLHEALPASEFMVIAGADHGGLVTVGGAALIERIRRFVVE